MNEVEIGGQLVPQQSFEAIAQIASNRTMLVQQLTSRPGKPEPVYGLKNIDEVFSYFQPSTKVEFENADGISINEELKFNSLSDFKREGLIAQSNFLKELNEQQDSYQGIIKQLKRNKILKSALQNPEARAAFLQSLQILIQELEQSE